MLEIDDVALNAAYWTQKKSGVQISLKNIEVAVVVLSLIVEWGVGMERQGPSYGEVVTQEMYEFRPFSEEVKALRLGARRRSTGLCVYELQDAPTFLPVEGGGLYRVRQDPNHPLLQGVQCT